MILTMRTVRPMWVGEVRSPTPSSPAGCLAETGYGGLCVALRSAREGEGRGVRENLHQGSHCCPHPTGAATGPQVRDPGSGLHFFLLLCD